jgi:hypothetical protein
MSQTRTSLSHSTWKGYELLLFRFFFIYFIIQAVPLDWKYYRSVFQINWLNLHYGDIFNLTRYSPKFVSGADSFYNWAIASLIALIGLIIWTIVDKRRSEYNLLNYWLRVIVRYRLAIGVIGYGFIKLFPLQAPFPSLSNLNTHYGDFSNWKIFSISLGIVPGYESFLGLVEITAGILLLFRKTSIIGAFIVLLFTGNVFLSNLAYEGGEHIYSLYLVSLALFILSFDLIRLYTLFALEKPATPNRYRVLLETPWQRVGRLAIKGFFIFFFIFLYGFKTYSGAHKDPYQFPKAGGLKAAAGLYDVSEFRINNQLLPYSATDSIRWKDVVFENWPTISIRSNRPVTLEHVTMEEVIQKDEARKYELSGSSGREYYHYTVDEEKQQIMLTNKNKNYAEERWLLHYTRPNNAQLILSGVNERYDSVYVVLNKLNKKYLLIEAGNGRGKPIKL